MSTAPTLFADCVLPGCRNPSEAAGQPCHECRTVFGNMLRTVPGGAPMTAEQVADRDAAVRAAYAAQKAAVPLPLPEAHEEPERRRNQLCWLCEERHTCTLVAGRWECDTCRTVEAAS